MIRALRPAAALAVLIAPAALAATTRVTQVRCEYLSNPIGIDAAAPRFSWVVESPARGARQTAYQILVASAPEKLKRGEGDVWDSGKVESDDNAQIAYKGPALEARRRYHFAIRVWDEHGTPVTSEPAFFEMGQGAEPWRAKFVALAPRNDDDRRALVGARWIWVKEPSGGPAPRRVLFRAAFTVAPGERVRWAELHIAAAGVGRPWERNSQTNTFVNDTALRNFGGRPGDPRVLVVTRAIQPGENRIAIDAPFLPGKALIAKLRLELADGRVRDVVSDGTWKQRLLADAPPQGWRTEPLDGWSAAIERGAFGDQIDAGDPSYRRVDQVEPAILLRRSFTAAKPVARARLYVTAAGVYEAHLNGKKVGRDQLTPGWTDYDQRLRYQTYDVTAQIRRGDNVVGGVVAGGWFSGRTGMGQNLWGYERALLAELHLEYRDGSREVIATDESWRASTGPIRRADLLDGELYDARREAAVAGWDAPGFADASWAPAAVVTPKVGRLEAQLEPPVRAVITLPAKKVTTPAPGVQVFDLGQNMVGVARVKLRAPAGTTITLRYAEMLNRDGTMFTDNLRTANAIDRYVARGGGDEVYEPRFTFHGFRYVEVSGAPAPLPASAVTGLVWTSDLPQAGKFETSNALLNRLQSNIVWGQRSNFVSIPTDCPQRDERLGWTGDINMFARTATYNADAAAFLAKYLIDLEDGQDAEGRFPDVAPTTSVLGNGNFAWGDVGVMLPWLLYRVYGDTRVLERHFDAMKKWVDFRTRGAKDYLNTAKSYGDWVSPPPQAPNAVIGPIYHALSARLLARAAAVLGKSDDAAKYDDLFGKIKAAWNRAYVKPDGKIESDTQTAYILALRYDMLPPEQRPRAATHLQAAIDRAGGHLATGFLGTGNLLHALSDNGLTPVAYDLLMSETYPSWLYTVKNGATTMWERWDSYSPETGPSNKGDMNSYNHYAFGAVGEWMYAHVAGIDMDAEAPAWKRVVIRPTVGGGLTWARGEHTTIRGKVASGWKVANGTFTLDVEVPVHATALVHVPAAKAELVKEGGRAASAAPGVKLVRAADGVVVYEVGAGKYRFSAPSS